ncbi:MAG: hypothetical protein F4047_14440 [Caldilineaceae bacterium SB0670_bin_27]|nr:hypothetical protein [Caldilineaceae bacterium SB0670_bin_27]
MSGSEVTVNVSQRRSRNEPAQARLRHINIFWNVIGKEDDREEIGRDEVDDPAVELLQPLIERAIASGAAVDIPGGYWFEGHQMAGALYAGIGRADLEGALKRYGDGTDTLVSMRLLPGRGGDMPELLVRNHYDFYGGQWEDTLLQIACEINDLERRLAWAWLDVVKRG